jgi:hypothetical protein
MALPSATAADVEWAIKAVNAFGDFSSNLTDLSSKLNVSTDDLQKLGYAGSLVGVSTADVGNSLKFMRKGLEEGAGAFAQLGLSIGNLRTMDASGQLAAIGAAISNIKDPAQQSLAAMEVFGRGGVNIMALLRSDIQGTMEEAGRFGLVIGSDMVSAGDAYEDSITKVSAALDAMQRNVIGALVSTPEFQETLEKITDAALDFSKWVSDHGPEIKLFWKDVAEILRGVADMFADIAKYKDLISLVVRGVPGLQLLGQSLGAARMYGAGLGERARLDPVLAAGQQYLNRQAAENGPRISAPSAPPGAGIEYRGRKERGASSRAADQAAKAEKKYLEDVERFREATRLRGVKVEDAFYAETERQASVNARKLLDGLREGVREEESAARSRVEINRAADAAMERFAENERASTI